MPAESFGFHQIRYEVYHYTDNRIGVDRHYLARMIAGRCSIVSEGKVVEIEQGDLFYIPKGCRYESFWYGQPHVRFDSFGFTLFPLQAECSFPVQVIRCTDAERALAQQLSENKEVSCLSLALLFGLMHRLMPQMISDTPSKESRICAQAESYLIEHPTADNAEVAKSCMVSESTLYAAFRTERKVTPNEMRQRICAERAVSLLTTTDLSIERISSELGFSSTSYFRKILKKHIGLTPREIRNTSVY